MRKEGISIHTLHYGDRTVSFTLPENIEPHVISYAEAPSGDNADLIRQALACPVQSPRLSELAKEKRNAVILISDGSRLCPSHLLLPALLDELNESGIMDRDITVVVALGMHRIHTKDELIGLTGADVYSRVKVLNHSALEEDCVYLGDTSKGTPVIINRRVVQAELLIAVGNIEPHRLVGMSGGIKAVIPGCASRKCIEANHSLSQTYKAVPGFVDNPVHEDLEEAQAFVPVHFLLNVIVNHRREIIAAAAGRPVPAHRSLLAQAKNTFLVKTPLELFDFTIVSAGGAPKDMQLYQAVKTMQNAAAFTKKGGFILLIAECSEHYGNGIMQLWAETIGNKDTIMKALEKRFVLGAHKLQPLFRITREHKVWMHSAMPGALLELLGFQPAAASGCLQDTINSVLGQFNEQGVQPQTAILPHGALTFSDEALSPYHSIPVTASTDSSRT
jgi:lactate racemase